MYFLIDTNIVVPLEPGTTDDFGINTAKALDFYSLARKSNNTICVHPAIQADLLRDRNTERATLRRTLINRYEMISSPPDVSILDPEIVGDPEIGSNDYVDNCLLAAVKADTVDFLVSEDKGIHRKAIKMGIEARVIFLHVAIELLLDLFDKAPSPPPSVDKVFVYQIEETDPIFDSLRRDYHPGFINWLQKCKRGHREAYVIPSNDNKLLSGLCIIKSEDQLPFGKVGKTLKLCTFKVSDSKHGQRYGELLLKAVFDYADLNQYDFLYFTAFERQEVLIAFAESFGFRISDKKNERGELIIYKILNCRTENLEGLSPFEFHVTYGPRKVSFLNNGTFAVPVKPEYHKILFPELEPQIALFMDPRPCGNSIKKAYICHSSSKQLKTGDNIMVYRSEDLKGFTALGVVEDTLRSSDPEEIARYVGTRTVYSFREITAFCAKRQTLAIRFRYAKSLNSTISLKEILQNGILQAPPQSITKLKKEAVEWIQEKVNM